MTDIAGLRKRVDPTELSHWFPIIEAAGIPVPKTIMVDMPAEAQESLWALFDGKDAGDMGPFLKALQDASLDVGFPCFLRTDHTSAKHEWSRTCFVSTIPDLKDAVCNIVYFSECAGGIGLNWTRWAVREFLPVISLGWCPQYGGMPVNREFRFFVNDGEIACWHPYWPEEALRQGGIGEQGIERLRGPLYATDQATETTLRDLAERTGRAIGGAWSVDILETERGWIVTDMAEAHKSFHWEGCPALLAALEAP